jgi:cysteinyl-tRNA synthetase
MGRKYMRFKPMEKGKVKMYTCGPTVWNYAHLGNLRTFVFYDILRRYLKYKGYNVIHVMNITDVEDRIIDAVRNTGKSLKELTSFYEKELMKDLESLNVEKFEYYPRATEHIDDIVSLIKKLIEKGYAYRAQDGSIYYDVSKFKRYGRLSGIKPKELKARARISLDHYEKTDVKDFALWKAWDEKDGEIFWETELGKGRPGWHIECSAMSMKYLGQTIDIHAGGKDLRFPHHENEIAQSEVATGKKFVRFWLHTEFLHILGEEMHKSKGNYVTLRDKMKEGWDPLTIRYFLISSHYRDPLNLTDEALKQCDAARKRLLDFIFRLLSLTSNVGDGKIRKDVSKLLSDFERSMDMDINVPRALSSLFTFVRNVNRMIDSMKVSRKDANHIIEALKRIDSVLGIVGMWPEPLPEEILKMIKERENARKKGRYDIADSIRKNLEEMGIILEDTQHGTVWKIRSTKENITAQTN